MPAGIPGNAGFPQIGGLPQVVICGMFPLACANTGSETGLPPYLVFLGFPVATIAVNVNGSAPNSPQGNAAESQTKQDWNIRNPSPEICGEVKKVVTVTAVVAGASLSVGTLFPVTAPVTYTIGVPAAINAGIFGLYCAAFCRSWSM